MIYKHYTYWRTEATTNWKITCLHPKSLPISLRKDKKSVEPFLGTETLTLFTDWFRWLPCASATTPCSIAPFQGEIKQATKYHSVIIWILIFLPIQYFASWDLGRWTMNCRSRKFTAWGSTTPDASLLTITGTTDSVLPNQDEVHSYLWAWVTSVSDCASVWKIHWRVSCMTSTEKRRRWWAKDF